MKVRILFTNCIGAELDSVVIPVKDECDPAINEAAVQLIRNLNVGDTLTVTEVQE